MKDLISNLIHPYSRYGLAVTLLEARVSLDDLTEENLPEFLAQAIEQGLENFRFTTDDNPETEEILRFSPIKYSVLSQNSNLVQSAGLAARGKYIAPSVLTTDGDAKGTFTNATKIIELLRNGESLEKSYTLSRSFAPTTAKLNNGKGSMSPPKGTLFESACSVIATLTPRKPASLVNISKKEKKVEFRNVIIIPDLPIADLKKFVQLFSEMMTAQLDGNLMEAKLSKPEYHRPKIFNGNYPFAPRNSKFGVIGLLAAIGRWGLTAKKITWAKEVLTSIGGDENNPEKPSRPLYIISYDGIAQMQFTHHVVKLAASGELSEMIESLARDTRLYTDMDGKFPNRYASDLKTNYELFDLMTNRFLQLFTQPAFQDFLAMRAEYSSKIEPLFKEYFMEARKINREIVESARALGQWLNRTAYIVADSDVEKDAADRDKKVRQSKAKILVEFESAAMSATTPQDMLHRISTRAGRLLQQDMPAEATRFFDETMIGENILPKDAVHLLIAYLRLRSSFTKSNNQTDSNQQNLSAANDNYPVAESTETN